MCHVGMLTELGVAGVGVGVGLGVGEAPGPGLLGVGTGAEPEAPRPEQPAIVNTAAVAARVIAALRR